MNWIEAAARWYGVAALSTWTFAPMVRWLCVALSDRGATLSRPIAILATVYPAWLIASVGLAHFGSGLVFATLVVGGVFNWTLLVRRGPVDRAWLRKLAIVEVVSLCLFAGYLWLRGFTPEILGTEKPMDIAFLASSSRAVTMPPPDPWFAGEPINYYYLGYLLHGTIGRLAGVPSEIGFNLALATVFSMTTVAAFGIAWSAVRPFLGSLSAAAAGLLAAFWLSIAGNLYAPWRLLQTASETIDAWWWDSALGIGWRSSRIVCDGERVGNLCPPPATETINEFPSFSFLLGDLHPHLMALPYALVAIALAWNLASRPNVSHGSGKWSWPARIAVSGAIVGALYALNAWDLPAFLTICMVGAAFGSRSSDRGAWTPVVLLGLSAVGAWLPFIVGYDAPVGTAGADLSGSLANIPVIGSIGTTLAFHQGPRTSITEYLTLFGVPYVFGCAVIVADYATGRTASNSCHRFHVLAAAVATIGAGVLLAAPVIPLCGVPLALAVSRLVSSPVLGPRAFAYSAFGFAWFLSICVEFVYLRDVFDDRMNTLFKFYFQTWTFYALASGVAVGLLWARFPRFSWPKVVVVASVVTAVAAGLTYPTIASYQWTDSFKSWKGLDGLAYGEDLDAQDVAAIRWLSAHSGPNDVVLEAAGCSYFPFDRLPFNRVSAFTGVPSVVGWANHERQWRAGQPILSNSIGTRANDVAEMFADPSSALFDTYGVRWIFLGSYEQGDWKSECEAAGRYPGLGSPGYPGPGWEEAFRAGNTRIYQRIDD